MRVDYSAWIGFGVEVTIIDCEMPEKFAGWGVEEALEYLLDGAPVRICQAGTGCYGGEARWCLVAKSSHQGIGYNVASLTKVDQFLEPGWDMTLHGEVREALMKLRDVPWVKANSHEPTWIGAMWMH